MSTALLLIDLQQDYLQAAGLTPHPAEICARASALLHRFRHAGLPVFHLWTTINEAKESMPHWQRAGIQRCVAGTPGHQTPFALAPADHEQIIHKQFYSGFTNSRLLTQLEAIEADSLVLVGLYTRACIRTTAIDAYQHGYSVTIAEDATGDIDPIHAAITRQYLSERGIVFRPISQIPCGAPTFSNTTSPQNEAEPIKIPTIFINGSPEYGESDRQTVVRSPHDGKTASVVTHADRTTISRVVAASRKSTRAWQATPVAERQELAMRIHQKIEEQNKDFSERITETIGKPIRDAKQEVQFALRLIESAVASSKQHGQSVISQSATAENWNAIRRPHGVVAAITPWNNPLAIAVGKITPAILYGNTVVWKPAIQGAPVAVQLMQQIQNCGFPNHVINAVFGDHSTAEYLIRNPNIDALTLTGSSQTGIAAQVIGLTRQIPLQMELGGNNAAIVWSDTDLHDATKQIIAGGFGNAGQRCTATRRVIVDQRCFDSFWALLKSHFSNLRWGDPWNESTDIGPVVSAESVQRLREVIERARIGGGKVYSPFSSPEFIQDTHQAGYYSPPTLVINSDPMNEIWQRETFGPVVVIQTASSWQEALQLCNGVEQGLVAALFTNSESIKEDFLENANAGILKVNAPTAGASASAPFCGWKSSGTGPPEHGVGDIEFYTRWQVRY